MKEDFYKCGFYLLIGIVIGFLIAFLAFYKAPKSEVHISTQPIEKVYSTENDSITALNKETLMKELITQGVKQVEWVYAQALLETGYFTSDVCKTNNNLFGLRHSKGYYEFDSWQDSVKAYIDYIQYKYKGGDYGLFLERIGYAEDKNYVSKLQNLINQEFHS